MASNDSNTPKKNPSWKRRALWLLAFIIAFVAVKSFRQRAADENAMAQGGAPAVAKMNDIQEQAKQQHPDMPIGNAEQAIAASQSQVVLASKAGAQKADEAAGQFLGYYLANVRARPEYCKSVGVDITPFVEAFKQRYAAFYEKSRVINARGPYSADALEEGLYKQVGPAFVQTVRTNTEDMAKRENVSAAAVCQGMAEAPADALQQLDLQRVNPALYQAMQEAQ